MIKKYVAILILSLMIFQQCVLAQVGPNNARLQTRVILRRTAAIIITANKMAKKGGVYTGLGLATSHQIYAQKLFQRGTFRKAIFHSLRARIIAVDVIQLNRKNVMLNEAKFNQEEENFVEQSPPSEELDQTLETKEKQILDDNQAAKLLDDMGISLFNSNE